MKILVVVPALNEEHSILAVLNEINQELPESDILVIDDGSSDNTNKEARKNTKVAVLNLPFNVGVGGALRAGFKYAEMHGYTHVLQIDADGQHIPSEAKKLIALANENIVVIGSRFQSGRSDYPVGGARYFAMKILARILTLICKTNLTDVTSGFRLTTGNAISLFAKEYPRDYLGDTVESIILAHRANIQITETSVQMRLRQSGNPSQNIIKSIWYLARALIVIFLAMFKKRVKFEVSN